MIALTQSHREARVHHGDDSSTRRPMRLTMIDPHGHQVVSLQTALTLELSLSLDEMSRWLFTRMSDSSDPGTGLDRAKAVISQTTCSTISSRSA